LYSSQKNLKLEIHFMNLQEVKDHIKAQPISSIIGRFLPLSKRGTQVLALCPFHADTRPSLSVSDQKGLYMCFVCQKGGDAINFVERYKNLDFKDAISELAQLLGLSLDDDNSKIKKKDPKTALSLRILSAACRLYFKMGQDKNVQIFKTFTKERKLSEEVIKDFQLGFAPGNNVLFKYLQALPEKDSPGAIQMAIEIGLIRQGKNNYFDTFRERIIFPIWNFYGQVVGFGGRATLEHQQGKYVNSQDSFIFNKKNLLYGFHFAKQAIRDQDRIILVEGYMDLIALQKNGFKESIAVMGVALGNSSLKTIISMTKNIYLALDSDSAGLQAMTRMNQSFLQEKVVPKYLKFSPHKDPDEFLENEGIIKFSTLLEEAPTFLDFILSSKIPEVIPENTDQKLQILKQVFEYLAPLKMDLRATERVISLAKRLKLKSGSDEILNSYKQYLEADTQTSQLGPKPWSNNLQRGQESHISLANLVLNESKMVKLDKIHNTFGKETKKDQKNTSIPRLEMALLLEIFRNPGLLKQESLVEVLDFVSQNEVKRIVYWLKNFINEIDPNEYHEILLPCLQREGFSLEVRELAGSALFQFKRNQTDEKKSDLKILFDYKKKLMEMSLKREREVLNEKQRNSTSEDEVLELMKEIGEIQKKIEQLKMTKMKTNSIRPTLNTRST